MTFIETTDTSQSEKISLEFELGHSPAKVWRALTDPALLAQWLFPVIGLKLEPGTHFMLKAPAQPEWDGIVNCRMLEIATLTKLSYSWTVGEIDTVVTFALAPTQAGTHLSVEHTGFKPEQKRNFNGARYGWKMIGGKLVNLLAQQS